MRHKLVILAFSIVIFLGILIWILNININGAVGGVTTTIIVTKGKTLKEIISELGQAGVIKQPEVVYYYAKIKGLTMVKVGEYEIQPDQTPKDILKMLVRGNIKTNSFTIVEGLNRWQIRDQLANQAWLTPEKFDQLCNNASFLKQHKIPGPTCEGYFFPETYTFARGVAAEKIFIEVFTVYRRNFLAATKNSRGPLNLSEQQLVTLASIVEKETGAEQERPHIACVFYNRLKAKPMWRLETDPTVIYAATLENPKFDGNLKRKHMRKLKNPYNTYKNKGLPPGPIASAGKAAFDAVVNPLNCKDFFFVSKNNGRHQFCPDYECHKKAVQKWQIDYFNRPRKRSANKIK